MPDMINYLNEYGDISFARRNFCDADAIVLCQMVYCKFTSLILGGDPVRLSDVVRRADEDAMYPDPKYEALNKALVTGMISGRRFRDIQLSRYVDIVDTDTQTQFSAITCILPDGTSCVIYRGTDETLVGWQEDFNLTYMDVIPAHKYACMYLTEVSRDTDGPLMIAGHSKGGHLGLYACMHAAQSIRDRVTRIYCMDSPGFRDEMVDADGLADIHDRIVKYVPQSSLIGMIQEHYVTPLVLRSATWGLGQHNMYTWQIDGDKPVPDVLTDAARFVSQTLDSWILQVSPAQRARAAEIAWQVLSSCEADNRIDFMANFSRNVGQLMQALRDLDPEMAEVLRTLMSSLLSDMTQGLREERDRNLPPQVREWLETHIPAWFRKE